MARRATCRIIYFGRNRRILAFCARLAGDIHDFVEAELLEISVFEPKHLPWLESVYVISPGLLANRELRAALAATAKLVGSSDRATTFYICVGCTVAEVRQRYQDLALLFQLALVGNEEDLPALVKELRRAFSIASGATARRNLGLDVTAMLGTIPGFVIASLEVPVVSWALPTILLLAVSTDYFYQPWLLPLAYLSIMRAGTLAARLAALDFWPWLGCRWRFSDEEVSEYERRSATITGMRWGLKRTWVSGAAVRSRAATTGGDPAVCTAVELTEAYCGWKLNLYVTRAFVAIFPLCLVLPGCLLAWQRGAAHRVLAAMAFFLGTLTPGLLRVSLERLLARGAAWRGLTSDKVAQYRADSELDIRAELRRAGSSGAILLRHRRWLLDGSLGPRAWRRRWRPKKDFVFISYSWKDSAAADTVESIASTLDLLKTPYYLDRQHVRVFGTWRRDAAEGLARSTHLIVLAGPSAVASLAVQHEIQTCLARVGSDLPPAIVCVGDPKGITRLLAAADLSAEWRFVLTWCPRLTRGDVADQTRLGLVIRQRRRQGMLMDWLMLLGVASSSMERAIAYREKVDDEIHD